MVLVGWHMASCKQEDFAKCHLFYFFMLHFNILGSIGLVHWVEPIARFGRGVRLALVWHRYSLLEQSNLLLAVTLQQQHFRKLANNFWRDFLTYFCICSTNINVHGHRHRQTRQGFLSEFQTRCSNIFPKCGTMY